MIELGKHHELFSYIITSDSKLSFTTRVVAILLCLNLCYISDHFKAPNTNTYVKIISNFEFH